MSQNVATILPTQSVRQRMDDAGVLRLPEVAREWERLTREKLLEGMPETDIAEAVLLPVLGHNYSTRLVAQRLFESEEPVAMTVGSALLVETLGSGSFAQVSIVWHNGGLKVAKVLKVFDGCAPARFGREVEIMRLLKDVPGVSHITGDGGAKIGQPYYIMDFHPGWPMDGVLGCGPLPQTLAADVGVLVGLAMSPVHARGIKHRDLKPANMILTDGGEAKIIDFGLSAAIDAMNQTQITQSHEVMGTAAYMAPEQVEDPHGVTEAADVYALGCILYRWLTGRLPHAGNTPMQILLQHSDRTKKADLSLIRDRLLAEIIGGMLEKDAPAKRKSMAERAHDLFPFSSFAADQTYAEFLEHPERHRLRIAPPPPPDPRKSLRSGYESPRDMRLALDYRDGASASPAMEATEEYVRPHSPRMRGPLITRRWAGGALVLGLLGMTGVGISRLLSSGRETDVQPDPKPDPVRVAPAPPVKPSVDILPRRDAPFSVTLRPSGEMEHLRFHPLTPFERDFPPGEGLVLRDPAGKPRGELRYFTPEDIAAILRLQGNQAHVLQSLKIGQYGYLFTEHADQKACTLVIPSTACFFVDGNGNAAVYTEVAAIRQVFADQGFRTGPYSAYYADIDVGSFYERYPEKVMPGTPPDALFRSKAWMKKEADWPTIISNQLNLFRGKALQERKKRTSVRAS